MVLIVIILGFGALYVVSTTQQSSSDIRAKASNQTLIKVSGTIQSVADNKQSFTLPIDQVDNLSEVTIQSLISALQGSTWEVQLIGNGTQVQPSDNQTQCFQGSQETVVPCTQLVQVGKKVQVHTAPGDINIGKKKLKARKIYDRSQGEGTSTTPAPSTSSDTCLDTIIDRPPADYKQRGYKLRNVLYTLTIPKTQSGNQNDYSYISEIINVDGENVKLMHSCYRWLNNSGCNTRRGKVMSMALNRNIGRRCTIEGFIKTSTNPNLAQSSLNFWNASVVEIHSIYPPEN